MKKIIKFKKTDILLLVLLIALNILGCNKSSKESAYKDSILRCLDEIKAKNLQEGTIDRAELAISNCENNIIDPEPILINALLEQPEGSESLYLMLALVDEDKDIEGVLIKEVAKNAEKILSPTEEDYSVFIHLSEPSIVNYYLVPVQIRRNNKKKDGKLWQEYINADYEKVVDDFLDKDPNFKANISDYYSLIWTETLLWRKTLPPVWVSDPNSDKVDIWISVYDKAGNKSEPVKLESLN